MNQSSKNIETVEHLFLRTSYYLPLHETIENIILFLEKDKTHFASIKYECAAYELAYTDLKRNAPLTRYIQLFAAKGTEHRFHLQIGLGWAFAKAEINPELYIAFLQNHQLQLIVDGIGYYYALFKNRKTIVEKMMPPIIASEYYTHFYQGIGRRLWYLCKGNLDVLQHSLLGFEQKNLASLWYGIGVASAYVGGCSDIALHQLMNLTAQYKTHFSAGAAMACYSRVLSNTINASCQNTCAIVCNIEPHQLAYVIEKKPMAFDHQTKISSSVFIHQQTISSFNTIHSL
jgi:Protein of unknown function (DUF1702)